MSDKLTTYRRADAPLPDRNRLWPLYGAGFENLGRNGQPIEVLMPQHGPDELLVRHDACGLCFSDVKVIRAGERHPRIYRDMQANPVVLGHEVALTVVGVGDNLRDQYRIGDRFIVQADIYAGGVSLAYGYEIQGGQSQYSVIDHRVLKGDEGNYLIPVQPDTGYAESALTEPWTCVLTAYLLEYRTKLKPGGTTWIIGTGDSNKKSYNIGEGFDEASYPDRLLLTDVPASFTRWLKTRAMALGVEVIEVGDVYATLVDEVGDLDMVVAGDLDTVVAGDLDMVVAGDLDTVVAGDLDVLVDDIILLGSDPDLIETTSPHLAKFGIMAIIADEPLPRKVEIDVGRVHYNRWLYVGGPGPDIARAYSDVPARSRLKPGGRAWFVGAGGPMGRLHVQRAVEAPDGPKTIFCTARSDRRLRVVESICRADAEAKSIAFTCTSRQDKVVYRQTLEKVGALGFDDIMVIAQDIGAIAEAAEYLAPGGVMNIFAGVKRGTTVSLDLSDVYLRDVRFIGHSGLTTSNMHIALHQMESGEFSPNRLVAAVGSLTATTDGLRAVRDGAFSGKVVIFPNIQDLPLTPLPDLKDRLPTVFAKLKGGREWTVEAEEEFLRLMLA